MKESIRIKNFGPIEDVEINDIPRFMVLVGESGSGKSTILKTLAYFQWIFKMLNIRAYLSKAGVKGSPFKFKWDDFMRHAGFENYLKADTEIRYVNGSCEISYKKVGGLKPGNVKVDELSLEKISFITDKRNIIPYMLAGKIRENKDFYLSETLDDFSEAKKYTKEHNIDFLGVKISVEKEPNGERIYIKGCDDDNLFKVNFEDASSGMQNVSPLSMIVQYYCDRYDFVSASSKMVLNYLSESDNLKYFSPNLNMGEIGRRCVHIHIEEPELSLYPESQIDLIGSLVKHCFNSEHSHDIKLALATHSPYVVNYLNLLAANTQGKDKDNPYLSINDMAVYEITDGEAQDLKLTSNVAGKDLHIVNTRLMSDPLSSIYKSYKKIAGL